MTQTAIVVPIYRDYISPNELYSFIHIIYYLRSFPKILICPEDLQVQSDLFEIIRFPRNYFDDIHGYNQLMLSLDFYNQFEAFDYILIAQLDALVLSSQIEYFTQNKWDYIGAPWFLDENNPSKGFKGAGNGGFSLRRVSTFIDVLKKGKFNINSALNVILERPGYILPDIGTNPSVLRQLKKLNFVRKAILRGKNFVQEYDWNEDHFWAFRAAIFYEKFRVAPVEAALKFAFEMHPRFCWELYQDQLPFGCHAWEKYDPEFWKPYLIPETRIEPSISEIIRFS